MVYLDAAGLEQLWNKIKLNFVRYSSTVYSNFKKGDLLYIAANGTAQSADFKVTNLHVETDNPANYVLGIGSGVPVWKTISSSLSVSTNNTTTLGLKVTVLGTQSAEQSIPAADTTHAGIVTADTTNMQTFAGKKIFANGITLYNNQHVSWYDNPSQGTAQAIQGVHLNQQNIFHVGWYMAKAGYRTIISGNSVNLLYGGSSNNDPQTGFVLTNEGDVGIGTSSPSAKLQVVGGITARNDIQATQGGVAAMGIADLNEGGSGGGSGTVKSIQLGGNTPIPADVDGLVTLPAYTTTEADGYFASSLSITTNDGLKLYNKSGSVLSTISVASIRSAIGVGTPETAGGVPILDTNAKIKLANIPDVILGQVLYGGTVNASGVATLSTNVKTKLGITSNTVTLSNSAGTSSSYGWVRFEGVYFIMSADSSFASLGLKVGDWLISTGTAWKKIDNTDAVTGIKINNGTLLTGEVNIPAAAADTTGVVTTGAQTFAGEKTFTGNILKDNNTSIGWNKAASGTLGNMLSVNTSNQFIIGYSNATAEKTAIYGKTIEAYANNTKVLDLASTGASVTGTLGVSGATTLSSTLSVSGATTISNTLGVTGNATFGNHIYLANGKYIYSYNKPEEGENAQPYTLLYLYTDNNLRLGFGSSQIGDTNIYGNNINFYYSASHAFGIKINNNGYVGIGIDSPTSKLHVAGTANITGSTTLGSALSVTGASTLTGDVTLGNNLYLENNKSIYAKFHDSDTYNNILTLDSSGGLLLGWGTNSQTAAIAHFTRIYGTNTYLHYGTSGSTGMILDSSGNVGIGYFNHAAATPVLPDSKLHVKGTAHVTGNATFDEHIYIANKRYIYSYDTLGTNRTLLYLYDDNNLRLGFGSSEVGNTNIYGTNVNLYYYSTLRTLGTTLDSNGILTNIKSIQSTEGGVAAMGIADLALSGGGGGSGTVQSLQVNNATPIIPNTDGKLSLDAALTSDATNAVSLTIGGSTLNITPSTLRTSLGLGTVYSHGYGEFVTTLGVSGNTLTWSKGGVAQTAITVPYATNAGTLDGTAKNALLTTFSSASGDSPDTTVTVGGKSLTAKINADTVDGVQLWTFYKRGFVNSADSEAPTLGWYCVGQVEKSKSSNQYGVISLSVATQSAQRYGTLNIRYAYSADAASAIYLVAEWSSACGIDASKFVVTQKTTDTSIVFKLYVNSARGEGWAFSKIDEFRYGFIANDWTFNNVYSQSALDVIPSDEAQTESVIADINNKAADSAKLNGLPASNYATAADYLPLTGGTMSLTSEGALTLRHTHYRAIEVFRDSETYGYSFIRFSSNYGGSKTYLGYLGANRFGSNDIGPCYRTEGGSNKRIWYEDNAYLTLNPDADATTDDFSLKIGDNEVTVGPIPSSIIEALS